MVLRRRNPKKERFKEASKRNLKRNFKTELAKMIFICLEGTVKWISKMKWNAETNS